MAASLDNYIALQWRLFYTIDIQENVEWIYK